MAKEQTLVEWYDNEYHPHQEYDRPQQQIAVKYDKDEKEEEKDDEEPSEEIEKIEKKAEAQKAGYMVGAINKKIQDFIASMESEEEFDVDDFKKSVKKLIDKVDDVIEEL